MSLWLLSSIVADCGLDDLHATGTAKLHQLWVLHAHTLNQGLPAELITGCTCFHTLMRSMSRCLPPELSWYVGLSITAPRHRRRRLARMRCRRCVQRGAGCKRCRKVKSAGRAAHAEGPHTAAAAPCVPALLTARYTYRAVFAALVRDESMASTMLRACQRACSQMQTSFAPAGCARWMATSVWPTDVPVPAGAQPFDPKGPLSQIDTYVAGLDTEDPIVKVAKQMKDLRSAVEKLEDEARTVRCPVNQGARSRTAASQRGRTSGPACARVQRRECGAGGAAGQAGLPIPGSCLCAPCFNGAAVQR